MALPESVTFYPRSPKDWRKWLEKNHAKEDAIWLIMYRKGAGQPTITWSEAVDEALCFGWIDSVKKKLDDERSIQFFSRRKARSTWSKINKDKVETLIAAGKMTPAGMAPIELAKSNGSWELLDTVDAMIVPTDLAAALAAAPGATEHWDSLSRSARKVMLQSLVLAKRPETRAKRIADIAATVAQARKP